MAVCVLVVLEYLVYPRRCAATGYRRLSLSVGHPAKRRSMLSQMHG